MTEEKLSLEVELGIVLKSLLTTLPFPAGATAKWVYGRFQEKRFLRIERAWKEVMEILSTVSVKEEDIESIKEKLSMLTEYAVDERNEGKIVHYKKYFKSTVEASSVGIADNDNLFMEALAEMSLLECVVLKDLKNSHKKKVGSIRIKGVEQYAIIGAILRLTSRGFIKTTQQSMVVGGSADKVLGYEISVSPHGVSFYDFCLK